MDHVRVRVTAEVELDWGARRYNGEAPSEDQAMHVVTQCLDDAVAGAFGILHTDWRAILLRSDVSKRDGERRCADFEFGLPAAMFPVAAGGLQHLVGVLASDTFPSQVGDFIVKTTNVERVELPDSMVWEAKSCFGSPKCTIRRIRDEFHMADDWEPFVAFNFKPRTGFSHSRAVEVVGEVIGAGVRLVEFDTRNLRDPDGAMDEWLHLADIAAAASAKNGFSATFAPNLSYAPDIAIAMTKQWCETAPDGPKVVKVDGGLDGLSAVQAIRRSLGEWPIITSYPLLRSSLSRYLGSPDFWVDLMALSGVDIIYPGNRPTFQEFRSVGGDDVRGQQSAIQRYGRYTGEGHPMPTYAAGAHPGHLHASYELLGPDVGYFLGASIALHPDGPGAGAKLCVNVLREARDRASAAKRGGRPFGEPLSAKLIREIEEYRVNGVSANYIPPERVFLDSPVQPFYRRQP